MAAQPKNFLIDTLHLSTFLLEFQSPEQTGIIS